MAREIVIGNGRLLIALDRNLRVRDFFFPMVGLENHLAGHALNIGVWTENRFSWLGDGWEIAASYLPDTQVSRCRAKNADLGIELEINDAVHFSKDIFLRKIVVHNLGRQPREVRLFLSHDFHIYGVDTGDTALYHPALKSIVHYKGQRYFLINGRTGDGSGIYQYATGIKEAFGLEGTWRDAEDGELSGNPIAQGSVDSVVSFSLNIAPESEGLLHYWIACGKELEGVGELNKAVVKAGIEQACLETENYWSAWVNKRNLDLSRLPREVARLFKFSLMLIRMHVDNGGGVIASCDSEVLQFNRDTYAYVWPRDGAIAAMALDTAGFEEVSRLFFQFCDRVISPNGFFHHKYSTDGSQGSSWHPLIDSKGQSQLPVQEDETALVLISLWRHYQKFRDVEFISRIYPNLVIKTGDFLMGYIDDRSGLPKPSFDIWEERYGVFTATAAVVCAALEAGAKFAQVFFDRERRKMLHEAATRMKEGMLAHLYDRASGVFLRGIYSDGSEDRSADSSLAFLFDYGPFPAKDPAVARTMTGLFNRLWLPTPSGGLARYENDEYFRVRSETTGNPWFVCTLWMARWRIAKASSPEELNDALELIVWAAKRACNSGLLSEQIDPFNSQPISVSPLVWSHAEFILTVYHYLERYSALTSSPTI